MSASNINTTLSRGDDADSRRRVPLRDAADVAGYSYEPFRRLVARGDIPAVRHRGRIYIYEDDLNTWMTPTPVVAPDDEVTAWARSVAADAPPMTTDQVAVVGSLLRSGIRRSTQSDPADTDSLDFVGGAAA